MDLRVGVVVLGLSLAVGGVKAQSALRVDEAVARANVVKQVDPVYPPIARAAHVAGSVTVQVKVKANGVLDSTEVVGGPMMLRAAALDAVKQWKFKPLKKDGLSSSFTTRLVIPFSLGETVDEQDLKTAREYFALSDVCHKLIADRAEPAEQATACREAAVKAEEFKQGTRFIERRSAFVYAATALLRNKQMEDAIAYGTKAVDVVKEGHDDGSGSSAAYAVKGEAEALHGDLQAADANLQEAEKFQRAAIDKMESPAMQANYKQSLKQLLGFRSQVLDALGRTAEAEKLAAEANQY